jgi:hypothetical protein
VALSCHGDTPDKINDLGSFGTAEVKTKAKRRYRHDQLGRA